MWEPQSTRLGGINAEFLSDDACRNLHAEEPGLIPLSVELQRFISSLGVPNAQEPLLCSYEEPQSSPPKARRGPSRAKRRAWQRKARYQRKRCVVRLRPWQVEGLAEADRFARHIGMPLNSFLTVSWANTEQGCADILNRFQKALKSAGEWLRRRGLPAAWIYAHENPGGTEPHFHMLIHIPKPHYRDFQDMCSQWFGALEGGVHFRQRTGPADHCLSYMMKGTDFITARLNGARARRQGPVDYKRAGWSQSLGESARSSLKPFPEPLLNSPTPAEQRLSKELNSVSFNGNSHGCDSISCNLAHADSHNSKM